MQHSPFQIRGTFQKEKKGHFIRERKDVSKGKESNVSHGKNPFYKCTFSRGLR